MGQHPIAVAVDERSNRAFVVNQGAWDDNQNGVGPASVSMLDATTGAVLRTVHLDALQYLGVTNVLNAGPPLNAPPVRQEIAVDARTNRVFVLDAGALSEAGTDVTGPGWVYMLDATTGALLHKITLPAGPQAVAVDERTNRVFVAAIYDESVSVLDATTGHLLRHTFLHYGQPPFSLAVDERTNRLFVGSAIGLTMLDAITGAQLPTAVPTFRPGSGVVVDAQAGRVVTTAVLPGYQNYQNMKVQIWDASTGAVLVTRHLAEFAATPLAVDPTTHHAFLLALDTFHGGPYLIRMVDTRSGQTLYKFYTSPYEGAPDDAVMAVDARLGRLFVGEGNPIGPQLGGGFLTLFDTHTGHELHRMQIGGFPAVALDTRTNRVFVAGSVGDTVTVLNAATW